MITITGVCCHLYNACGRVDVYWGPDMPVVYVIDRTFQYRTLQQACTTGLLYCVSSLDVIWAMYSNLTDCAVSPTSNYLQLCYFNRLKPENGTDRGNQHMDTGPYPIRL